MSNANDLLTLTFFVVSTRRWSQCNWIQLCQHVVMLSILHFSGYFVLFST